MQQSSNSNNFLKIVAAFGVNLVSHSPAPGSSLGGGGGGNLTLESTLIFKGLLPVLYYYLAAVV